MTDCVQQAWQNHAAELRAWLRHQTHDDTLADDMLQDLFVRALRQGRRFCDLANARAWLFEVARNLLTDHWRGQHNSVALADDLQAEQDDVAVVDRLSGCLPRALAELSAVDRDALTYCDLNGLPQADFARLHGLSLSAAKSRVQRARTRLREHLRSACQVRIDACGQVQDFVPRAGFEPQHPDQTGEPASVRSPRGPAQTPA
ncbi:MAG: RNA polymerase sigma factor SigZ [Rhodoferax sp.]